MHWDFVLTCFEPITKVTGGIGTYARALLEQLSALQTPERMQILFLTPQPVDPDWLAAVDAGNFKVALIDCESTIGGVPVKNLGDEHSRFSFNASEYLEALYRSGDTFGLVEFSDFGRDGYYTIKKKRLGLIDCGPLAVRLHSPDLMLLPDNQIPSSTFDIEVLFKLEQEIYCYKYCDKILYGVDNMLTRVESETLKYNVAVRQKAVKVPHPFRAVAAPEQVRISGKPITKNLRQALDTLNDSELVKLVYTGRIERRKGIFEFIETIVNNEALLQILRDSKLSILACGRDTITGRNANSLMAELRTLIAGKGIEQKVVLADYIDQDDLYEYVLPSADAFVFPSLFENYPNALIETLPYGRPTLVSSRGGMPEIGAGFRFVQSYDPLDPKAASDIEAFLVGLIQDRQQARSTPADSQSVHTQNYCAIARRHNASMVDRYRSLLSDQEQGRARAGGELTVSFVILYSGDRDALDDRISQLRKCVRGGDEILTIADPADGDADTVERACCDYGVRSIFSERRTRPSLAKNVSAHASRCDLIQFLDPEDVLAPEGLASSRRAMELNPEIDFVYGIAHIAAEEPWMLASRDATADALEQSYTTSPILIRRAAFLNAGGFDESLSNGQEDQEFAVRLAISGLCGEAIPCVTSRGRRRSDSRVPGPDFQGLRQSTGAIDVAVENARRSPSKTELEKSVLQRSEIYLQRWLRARDQLAGDPGEKLVNDSGHHISISRTLTSSLDFATSVRCHALQQHFENNLQSLLKSIIDEVSSMPTEEIVNFVRVSDLFDPAWYLEINTDVKDAGKDPCEHYALYGANEGRSPNPSLSAPALRSAVESFMPVDVPVNTFVVFAKLVG